MLFDPIWLLVPVAVLFSAWMVYEHRRIDASKSTAYVVTSLAAAEPMHEWMLGGIENTNGKMIAVYTCTRCASAHHERRERA